MDNNIEQALIAYLDFYDLKVSTPVTCLSDMMNGEALLNILNMVIPEISKPQNSSISTSTKLDMIENFKKTMIILTDYYKQVHGKYLDLELLEINKYDMVISTFKIIYLSLYIR